MYVKTLFTAIILSAIAGCSVPLFAQQKQLPPRTDGRHKADADLDEWGTLRNTVKADGYQYDVAADDSYVHLGIKVYDYYLKRKMLTTGLIAGIGDLSITFPFPQEKPAEKKDAKTAPGSAGPGRPPGQKPPQRPAGDTTKNGRDTSAFSRFVSAIREMKIEGLPGGTRITDQFDKGAITGRLGVDDDRNLVYELSIPRQFLTAKKGKPETLSITIPAIKRNVPYTPYYNRMYDPYGRTYGGYGGMGGRYGGNNPYGYGYLPPMPGNTLPDGPDASLYKKTSLKTAVILP